jgi:hypothetical protein
MARTNNTRTARANQAALADAQRELAAADVPEVLEDDTAILPVAGDVVVARVPVAFRFVEHVGRVVRMHDDLVHVALDNGTTIRTSSMFVRVIERHTGAGVARCIGGARLREVA